MKQLLIAIDGPSGAGKGTIARTLSDTLGYRHIDTGAMYRAVGWKASQTGIPLDDERALADLARRARALDMAAVLLGVALEEEEQELRLRYFDQSHLIREMRHYFDMTPGQLQHAMEVVDALWQQVAACMHEA